jgi:phage FluMu protein gp41
VNHFTGACVPPAKKMRGMDAHTQNPPSLDLYTLELKHGLPASTHGGKAIKYRLVRLRDTNVGDERWACRQAERVVTVGGVHKLLVSEEDFKHALTVRHIECFECDGVKIGQDIIDLALIDKLTSYDLGLIEQRVFLITLAAEVRNGVMSQADFDAILAGTSKKAQEAPQPLGQVEGVGQAPARAQPGPELLADYAGERAHSPTEGHGHGAAAPQEQALTAGAGHA